MKPQAMHALVALVAGATAAPNPQGIPAPPPTESSVLVGDGSPRQAYRYEQVTESIHCGAEGESCSISQMEIKSSTWGFNVGVGGPESKYTSWISGGFSVSETKSTGHTASCQAGSDAGSNSACVWARIAYTGYEVEQWEHRSNQNPEDGQQVGDPFYVWSPNSDEGHGYVCAHDDECWSEGDEWWGRKSIEPEVWESDKNAVGPQKYVWGSEPEDRWN